VAELKTTGWHIVAQGFDPGRQRWAERIFSLGNGVMGHRGSFEETYSGDSEAASYLSGLFAQEPVGQKPFFAGYPTQRAVLANVPAWIGLELEFDGESLDLARCEVLHFEQVLHLKEALLERSFTVRMPSGRRLAVVARRFCSAADRDLGVLQYIVQPLDFSGTLALTTGVDANAGREGNGTAAAEWAEVEARQSRTQAYLLVENKQSGVQVCAGMKLAISLNGAATDYHSFRIQRDRYAGLSVDMPCKKGDRIEIVKFAAYAAAHQDKDPAALFGRCRRTLRTAARTGFAALFKAHAEVWAGTWGGADVQIEGQAEAQDAVRFSLFHLLQAYHGNDERLGVGLHGLTGDKYGAAASWPSDIFLPPFYAAAHKPQLAKSLLLNRYRQLPKAAQAAAIMGFEHGAVLFPFATVDGEEATAQWELTFEAVHRNAAVAYAVYRYVLQTGDRDYLHTYGLETLTGIARFWAQRAQFCPERGKYMLQGVTGPNEYEVNVNNNWYTNYMAAWCLRFAAQVAAEAVHAASPPADPAFENPAPEETARWIAISQGIWLPFDEEHGIFLQQEGFLQKATLHRSDIPPDNLPLWKHWTWDRILRSPFLRHADVLQAFLLFENDFTEAQLARHFDFYEPLTMYESGLAFAVHGLLAARMDRREMAHSLIMRALRLDLDDWGEETKSGCDLPAMAAAWWAVIFGIAGLSAGETGISLRPSLPFYWKSLRFPFCYRNCRLQIHITKTQCHLVNLSEQDLKVHVFQKPYTLPAWGEIIALNAERIQSNES
jgi:maltose phosphorylase